MELGSTAKAELESALGKSPALVTERGELFLSERFGAIRLKVSMGEYVQFLNQLPAEEKPSRFSLLFPKDASFHVAIMAPMKVSDGKTFVKDREVVFL